MTILRIFAHGNRQHLRIELIFIHFLRLWLIRYDKNPKSLMGRFWRWHINFCPGWKNYFTHQDDETKATLRQKYNFKKY